MPEDKTEYTIQERIEDLKTIILGSSDERIKQVAEILDFPYDVNLTAFVFIININFSSIWELPDYETFISIPPLEDQELAAQRFSIFLDVAIEAGIDFGTLKKQDLMQTFIRVNRSLTAEAIITMRQMFFTTFSK